MKIFRKSAFNLYTPYWGLVLVRVVLVLVPQLGYIHPDEYFQSIEVMAGKFLDAEVHLPWEFNTTFPIRSMTIPYFTVGMTYKMLRDVNFFAKEYLPNSILTPYYMLVLPRLLFCFLSFLVDCCLYKICVNNNEKYKSKLLILSSSYVMITYGTRTFSNTVELILLAILLYLVCESLTFSNILKKKREYINYRYDNSKTVVEKAQFHKLRLYLASDSLRNCFFISTVTVFGFFNRPTFLAFAVFPIFFWLYRGIDSKSVAPLKFHARIAIFAVCCIPSFILHILIDSLYYGYLTMGEIGMLDVSLNSFVVTPLNFLKYNIDSSNLAKHGLHPKFLHVLVNIPLLFNILGVCALLSLPQYVYLFFQRKYHLLPTVRSIKGLMILSTVAPVALLSIFPHQEPRFLIPIIIPLVYLYANTIHPELDTILVEAPKVPIKNTGKAKPNTHYLLNLWLFLNTICVIFYGFLHQSGVYPVTNYLATELKITPLSTDFHIVTSSIYNLPESFLLQKSTNKVYSSKDTKYEVSQRVYLYEEGSNALHQIVRRLNQIIRYNEHLKRVKPTKKYKLFLIISSSLQHRLNEEILLQNTLNFTLVQSFYPHISTEAIPDLSYYCPDFYPGFYEHSCTKLTFFEYLYTVGSLFGLNLYEITGEN